ncbi:hypothetical protein CAOG_08430 [Capsaspora owczarzaki ATCC 30864]|uniref:RNA exonuclease 4 n=1 Tax=Capsaspora owczarzaki (strain ATCC 30864) TaxID=595528 RepID=A0A0D2WHH0_CAPO3|nr:hypothetical protein CAOG_08430 [Capsaspora owczarzaki ATCC 30864]KJE89060.1 hypothetical protein CAOG_008430 [Capsaspora owczarzaki ATCC 30864]|eukprot:XP_011270001.1 hypothetical protein CAOG_08430 [Capsaspora owczarzaki ATCC 30864]
MKNTGKPAATAGRTRSTAPTRTADRAASGHKPNTAPAKKKAAATKPAGSADKTQAAAASAAGGVEAPRAAVSKPKAHTKKPKVAEPVAPLPALPSKPGDVSANWKALMATLPPSKPQTTFKRRRDMKRQENDQDSTDATGARKRVALDESAAAEPLKRGKTKRVWKDLSSLIAGDFAGPTKFIAVDCEMVGVGERGERSALARVSVVNYFGQVLYDSFVKPQERVTDYRTRWSGVRPKDLVNAVTFAEAQKAVSAIIRGRKLVAHAASNDLQAMLLSHPKHDLIDTSLFRPFKQYSKGRTPGLKRLAMELLDVNIQIGEHSSVEDARATMAIFRKIQPEWDSTKNMKPSEVRRLKEDRVRRKQHQADNESDSDEDDEDDDESEEQDVATVEAIMAARFGNDDDDEPSDAGRKEMDYEEWTARNAEKAQAKLKARADGIASSVDSMLSSGRAMPATSAPTPSRSVLAIEMNVKPDQVATSALRRKQQQSKAKSSAPAVAAPVVASKLTSSCSVAFGGVVRNGQGVVSSSATASASANLLMNKFMQAAQKSKTSATLSRW